MPFSTRTSWNIEPSVLARANLERARSGRATFDLTASNPTRVGLAYNPQLLSSLSGPQGLDYDPQPLGSLQAREAVCRYYADHGVEVRPNQTLLTTSTSEAYSYLFRLLCDAGNEVVVPQPGYPLFEFLADLDDVRIKGAPLVYDQGWQIDPEGLRRTIGPATRAIVLVHPNNPTGHFTKRWEVQELARLCHSQRISLIVDEVFLDYGLDSGKVESFAAGVDGVNVFVVSGLSKIAGLPQMKAAWMIASGPDAGEAMSRLEVIADTFLSMNAPVAGAIPLWIAGRASIQSQILGRVRTNLSELDRQIAQNDLVTRLKIEGGWYAVLRIPAFQPDERTVLEMLDLGVSVHPGFFYGMEPAGRLVVSLLGPVEEFRNGVDVLVNYFRTHQGHNNCPVDLKP